MAKLIMCQGLPGSGKTTWAQSEILQLNLGEGGTVLGEGGTIAAAVWVSKDDIRRKLEQTGWRWSPENEGDVLRIRDSRITNAFKDGVEVVISDDTNLGRKHKARLEQLAREAGAAFEIKRFDVHVEKCIRRDAQRTGKARVGEEVIRKMAAQYGIEQQQPTASFLPVVYHPDLMPAVICDLDGTISLFKEKGHRGPYDATLCDQDDVNRSVRLCIRAMNGYFVQVIYLSGRFERYRPQTTTFLNNNMCPPGPLYMRADDDMRNDSIVKYELFNKHVRDKYNVLFVLDDRDRVVKMWRSIGLTCFQVNYGDF